VALAPGGAEALRQIEANPPAIIITDIYLPDTDGFELINEVRKRAC
jgi:YesN/AraC family two-component response regulator